MKTIVQIMGILIVIFSVLLTACSGTENPSEPSGSLLTIPLASSAPALGVSGTSTSVIPTSGGQSATKTASELVSDSLAAIEKLKTVKMKVDTDMIIEVIGGDQPGKMTMSQSASGDIDNFAKKMIINMNISMDIPYSGKQNIAAEIYGADGWLYMKTGMPGMEEQWLKMKLTEDIFKEQSGISNMTTFMQSAADYTLEGSERVNGVDCYMITIVPDQQVISNWFEEQLQTSTSGFDLSQTDLIKTFKKMAIKEWIAKDSHMLIQEKVSLLTEMKAEDLGQEASSLDKMTMNINMTMNYSDFDHPVNVVIPAEAQKAKEVSSGQ